MVPGPSTVRADAAPDKLAKRLRAAELTAALVTTPDGVLLGVVRAVDLDAGAR